IIADKQGERVTLRYRNGRSASANYPEIVRAVRALAPERVVLDGEIVAFDAAGKPSFQRLGPRIQARRPLDVTRVQEQVPVVFLVFDLLALGSLSLLELPLEARKSLVMELVQGKGYLRSLDHLKGDGGPLFELCKREGLEGVVAKRISSRYRPGPQRSDDWVKIKTEREEDFVVVGRVPGRGQQSGFGALCVASYRQGDLVFRGRVGSGLDDRTLRMLDEELDALATDTYPCVGEVPPDLKRARFARPELVVNVRYLGWTDEGRLRHPVFRGLRRDMDARQCQAHPPDELPPVEAPVAERTSERVHVSNQDKVFWPD